MVKTTAAIVFLNSRWWLCIAAVVHIVVDVGIVAVRLLTLILVVLLLLALLLVVLFVLLALVIVFVLVDSKN